MKSRTVIASLCLACALGSGVGLYYVFGGPKTSGAVAIQSVADFNEPLAAAGDWVDVRPFGRCWRPAGVSVDWRPYCDGDWEWTDFGWYWDSDEPWAWACYHYGTWVDDPDYGWIWIPGIEWAPAWVIWRMGDDYVGWAPCGPPGYQMESSAYVFVRSAHFHDRIRREAVMVNSKAAIDHTVEIKNMRRVKKTIAGRSRSVVVNEGPGLAPMEKATKHKFTKVPVERVYQQTPHFIPKPLQRRDKVKSHELPPKAQERTAVPPTAKEPVHPNKEPDHKVHLPDHAVPMTHTPEEVPHPALRENPHPRTPVPLPHAPLETPPPKAPPVQKHDDQPPHP